jgi:hypothetical protein
MDSESLQIEIEQPVDEMGRHDHRDEYECNLHGSPEIGAGVLGVCKGRVGNVDLHRDTETEGPWASRA